MNKYYQPELEELYIGYKCEYNLANHFIPITFKHLKEYIKGSFTFEEVFKMNEIRTKYLDIEDIESLGFIKSSMQFRKKDLENYIVGFSNRFDNDLIHVYIDKKYNNIKIVKEEIVLKDGFEELEYETLFKGSCKSINELKLILKMIGYE